MSVEVYLRVERGLVLGLDAVAPAVAILHVKDPERRVKAWDFADHAGDAHLFPEQLILAKGPLFGLGKPGPRRLPMIQGIDVDPDHDGEGFVR